MFSGGVAMVFLFFNIRKLGLYSEIVIFNVFIYVSILCRRGAGYLNIIKGDSY